MRATVMTAGLALVAGLLVSAGPAGSAVGAPEGDSAGRSFPAPGVRVAPRRDAPLEARFGTLDVRRTGDTGSGARRLTSPATVRQDLVRDRASATVVLDAEPTAGTASQLIIEFGFLEGTTCVGDHGWGTPTFGTLSPGFTRSGRTIRMDLADSQAGYETWDCAFAALLVGDAVQSALIGGLTDVYAEPRLTIGRPEQLGRKVKALPLVRGVWTVLTVPVVNKTRADADKVRVTGSGKGLKVKPVTVPRVWEESNASVRLQVKRVGASVGRLRLVAKGADTPAARRFLATKAIRPPKRPAPGTYTNGSGRIDFRITGGAQRKVAGFRIYTMTTCGGFPDPYTYTMNYYDFPTTVVPRDGVLDRKVKAELYTVYLRLKAVAGQVRSARFAYYGPNRCFAVDSFTAKRVGR